MGNQTNKLFKDTQAAVEYGEQAKLEDMTDLIGKLMQILTQKLLEMSFATQLFNESYHAFIKDDWYTKYKQ